MTEPRFRTADIARTLEQGRGSLLLTDGGHGWALDSVQPESPEHLRLTYKHSSGIETTVRVKVYV